MSGPSSGKKSLEDLAAGGAVLEGARVFMRVDLNAPLTKEAPITVTDDTRLRAALPSINFLKEKGAKVILASHLGRPKKQVVDGLRMAPVAARLSELLGKDVLTTQDCIGDEVTAAVNGMGNGEVLLLENVRFHAGEEGNDAEFSAKLAELADFYVNDAFGTAHRAHASTAGITKSMDASKCVSGFLMEKELKYLKGAVDEPVRPMGCIIGGAKVSSKITVIEALLDKCNVILLGGGMIFTFMKSKGLSVGSSLVEDDYVELASKLLAKAESKGVQMLLPSDVVIADKFAADAENKVVKADAIPDGWMGLDIGPDAIADFKAALTPCKTVIWNGPMGVFEMDAFAKGTFAIADILVDMTASGSTTIIGGGDSVAAVEKAGLSSKMSHMSTGGGASLELLEGWAVKPVTQTWSLVTARNCH
ncbi:unnamed protein product [Chrysoparadoxa australica]